jgi:hypothetical protein
MQQPFTLKHAKIEKKLETSPSKTNKDCNLWRERPTQVHCIDRIGWWVCHNRIMSFCKLAMITSSPDYSLSRIWSIACHRHGRACLKWSNTNTFLPQKKPTTFPSIPTRSIQNWTKNYTFLHPSNQTHNYFYWSYYTLVEGSYVYDPNFFPNDY